MIYVQQGPSHSRAMPRKKSVTFGFAPPNGMAPVKALTFDVKTIASGFSVTQAIQKCNERSASGD